MAPINTSFIDNKKITLDDSFGGLRSN